MEGMAINTVYLDLETYDNMTQAINQLDRQLREAQATIGRLKMALKDDQLAYVRNHGKLEFFYGASDIDALLGIKWEDDPDIKRAFEEADRSGYQE